LIYYPVIRLLLKTGCLTLEITPSEQQETPTFCTETVGAFEVSRGTEPCHSAPLIYCAEPEPGLVCIQATEQTNYDLWLEWESKAAPLIFLGDDGTLLPIKHHGEKGYAILNWGNYVGRSTVRLVCDGQQVTDLPIEVRSLKIDYLDDYRMMLDDISERLSALIFGYASPTVVYTQRVALDEHVAYLDYLFLRYLMDEKRLPLHFRLAAADPHRTTEHKVVWTDLALVRSLTPRSLQAIYAHPEHLARSQSGIASIMQSQLQGFLPRQLLDDRVVTTFDTAPNRFVKHFLEQLILKLRELESLFKASNANIRSEHLVEDCHRWWRNVENLARATFLEEVGEMHVYPVGSQVLLKREGYRQLNDYYRRFLLTGKVIWEGFEALLKTPNKDMATLYEYWCFFQLVEAVADALGAQIDPRQFIVEEGGVFRVTLDQSGKSWGQVGQATVYYNRFYRHRMGESYSVILHPDYTVELSDGRRLVFDAKYKYHNPGQFMSRDMSEDEERQEEVRLVYKKGDLYKMHTYRDALDAQAVFVLYPGNEFRAYHVEGRTLTTSSDLSETFKGVGAIPTQVYNSEPLVICLHQLLASQNPRGNDSLFR
jgi:predicted component of viral defense system (DUF524 family)